MSDTPTFTFGGLVTLVVVVLIGIAVAVHLLPIILQFLVQLLPAVLVVWFIVSVFRGIVKKLLD